MKGLSSPGTLSALAVVKAMDCACQRAAKANEWSIMERETIILAHGSGGSLTRDLVRDIFLKTFDNPVLSRLEDSAALEEAKIAFTTDSYVVKPPFFPGGDIGKLSVCGTVNDLAVMGAHPLYISCGFIIEEGLALDELAKIAGSMARAASEAGVSIVAGDTKVVERGSADKIFITTSGIGILKEGERPRPELVSPGDAVLISGTVGDHGVAVLSAREGLYSSAELVSDCAALNGLIDSVMTSCRIKFMRDPTRGGLATVLNELSTSAHVGIELIEDAVPMKAVVRSACELLGFEALYMANEGRVLLVVEEGDAEGCLELLRAHPLGREASIVGSVVGDHPGKVFLRTSIGGHRVLDMLTGEQLPRIC
jgi:hydrogenase expression/formation protein HypE